MPSTVTNSTARFFHLRGFRISPCSQDGEPVQPGRRLQSRLKLPLAICSGGPQFCCSEFTLRCGRRYKPYRFELTYVRRDDGLLAAKSYCPYISITTLNPEPQTLNS